MMNKGILTISFGTSVDETRQKNICAVERDIAECFPGYMHETAITSGIILKILAKRGVNLNTVDEAIENLINSGVRELYIQPTHLICGEEYDKIVKHAMAFSNSFDVLKIGKPLLTSSEDLCIVAEIIAKSVQCDSDECLILMGHGTEHTANSIYPAMDYVFKQMGFNHIFVGAVEGYPDAEMAINFAKQSGYNKAVFAPMMLVAGEHAKNDMSGEQEDSWVNLARKSGMSVRCKLQGLGEMPQIRKIYVKHLEAIVNEK